MDVTTTDLPGVLLIRPQCFADDRGSFCESFNLERLGKAGLAFTPVQDNHVLSRRAGTVRGLHFQRPPHAQAKLIRVLSGAIFDAVVDLRPGSATYGRSLAVTLDAAGGWQFFVPAGFAHGYCSLRDDTEVLYKVDQYWSKPHEGGLFWADPALAIPWPVTPDAAIIAERDADLPLLSSFHQREQAA